MNTFETIRNAYPDWGPAYPSDWKKPSKEEIERIESVFGIQYSRQFIDFQLSECHTTPMGDFAFDNFGWAEPSLGPMENLGGIVADAQEAGVPANLAPFKQDNGDYVCLTESGEVVIWDHNSNMIEQDPRFQWGSFVDWLAQSFDDE